ncbi:MAG TPA: FHA domain-containing protein [Myxococcaceae bacterium]|nr:FHA domain-containing protein [Myxococcaceae bacterium]
MRLLLTHLDVSSPIELNDGEHVLGGSPEDDVFLAPLPATLLTLRIEGPHLTLESRASFHVDGLPFPAGRPRELLVGERVELPADVTLQIAPEASPIQASTRALFLHMLGASLSPPSPHLPQLICVAGQDRGRRFTLEGDSLQLGRGVDAELRLKDRSVSRLHAQLVRDEGCWWVEDLGGPNGVWTDGLPAPGRTPLYDGSLLELGRTLLRLRDPSRPRPVPPAPPSPWWQLPLEELRGISGQNLWLPGLTLAVLLWLVGLLWIP